MVKIWKKSESGGLGAGWGGVDYPIKKGAFS